MRKLIFYLFLSTVPVCLLPAQQVITSAAGQVDAASIQISWTLGETKVATFVSTGLILTQGQQQSPQGTATFVREAGLGYAVEIFPNPGRDRVRVIRENVNGPVSIEVMDQLHRRLFQDVFPGREYELDVSRLPVGVYFIRIQDGRKRQTFQLLRG